MTPGNSTPPSATRLITPDVARGLTLLGIAVANVTTFWTTPNKVPGELYGGVVDGSTLDIIAIFLGAIFVHVRGVAMFSTMLGFGVGMLLQSLDRRHYSHAAALKVLLWRYGLLAIFGLIHCVLIFWGDIMLFYGLAGMLLAALCRLSTKILIAIASGMFAIYLVIGVLQLLLLQPDATATNTPGAGQLFSTPETYLDQVKGGLLIVALTPLTFIVELLMLFPLMIVGLLMARRGVLAHPQQHRRLLVVLAGAGLAVMVAMGSVMAASSLGWIPLNPLIAFGLNQIVGLFTGPAIVAMIALAMIPVQARLERQPDGEVSPVPGVVVMLAALGKRSMSGYVAQSFLFSFLVAHYGLHLADGDGAFEMSVVGVCVWLLTLVGAYALEKAGKPGPFEALHRRLAYGKRGLASDYRLRAGVGFAPAGGPAVGGVGDAGMWRVGEK
ncbi:DUF418 domain-containing protein [Corynebacterium aquilae]|uniref:DUF418 domain-containing protein n=1 Tax=Corynebacterium aquilae TaxID=203263 RepID=UPI000952531B|nr:DUF418 domain-containing protein [Corynebacterium aquilae]